LHPGKPGQARYKTGWNVQARVQIKMHEKDRVLIQSIPEFFGGIIQKENKSLDILGQI
jgi:hypothetical protein